MKIIDIAVDWHPIWYSKYFRGAIKSSTVGIERIYKHGSSGQIRIYSPNDLDGRLVRVNDGPTITVKSRGRFGKLYIEDRSQGG